MIGNSDMVVGYILFFTQQKDKVCQPTQCGMATIGRTKVVKFTRASTAISRAASVKNFFLVSPLYVFLELLTIVEGVNPDYYALSVVESFRDGLWFFLSLVVQSVL